MTVNHWPPKALPLRLIAWGALGVALHIGLARFGYGVVLPSLRVELGLGYTASGVLNAVHLGGYLLATLAGPLLARRVGMGRLAMLAHLLVAAGALGCALAPDGSDLGLTMLGAGRLATGLGAGAAVMAIMVTVLGAVGEASRSAVSVALWSGMVAATIGCGLAAPWLLDPGLWRLQFAAAAALAVVLALFFPRAGDAGAAADAAGARFTLAAVATPRWIWLVAAYFCFGVGYIAYATFAGARLAAAPSWVTATMWTVLGCAMLLGSLTTLLVLASARLRPHALPGALACAAVGSAVAGLAGSPAAVAGAVLVGLGMVATPALVTAAARTRSSAADYARAFSIATAALGLGQLAGPVVAGALADAFGSVAAPMVAAAAYGAGALCATIDRLIARRA